MEIRAVLFDLDGVLVLTEQLKAEAHTETIRMLGGAHVPISFYDQFMGQSHEAVRSAFLHAGGIADANPQTYTSTFREIYRKLLETDLTVTPGIPDILQLLVKQHFRLAIVSSSSSKTLHWILEKTNLVQFFDALVSSDDVDAKKPSPDPYLRALKLLQPTQVHRWSLRIPKPALRLLLVPEPQSLP